MSEQSLEERGTELLRASDNSINFLSDDVAVLESQAGQLISASNLNSAHLGAVLCQLRDRGRHLDRGFETFNDFVENYLSYSHAKARNYMKSWECFVQLGLPQAAIPQISWTKFGALVPAIERNLITSDNIVDYLPLIEPEGPHALRVSDIQNRIGREVADLRSEEAAPEDIAKVSLPVRAEDRGDFERNLQVCKEHFNEESGETVLQRMAAHCAGSIMSGAIDSEMIGGLSNLKRTAETLAPGVVAVFIGASSDPVDGVIPVTHVYWTDSPENMVLAISEEDAAEFLACSVSALNKASLTVTNAASGAEDDGLADLDELLEDPDAEDRVIAYAQAITEVDSSFTTTYQEKFNELAEQHSSDQLPIHMLAWIRTYAANKGIDL